MTALTRNPSFCLLTTSYPCFSEMGKGAVPRGKFVHDMAKSLVARGYEVHVVTHYDPGESRYVIVDGVHIHRFHYFIPKLETLTGGSGIPENIKELKNKLLVPFYFLAMFVQAFGLISKYRLSHINAHWAFPTGFIGVILKYVTGRPLIITAYGAELFPLMQGKMGLIRPFVRHAIRRADIIAGISQATVDAVRELSGREQIALIPDGIDMQYYFPGPRDETIVARYGLQGHKTIFFTGRMVERKGHRFLLEAMKHVRVAVPEAKLILGGGGPLESELRDLLQYWGLKDVVEMPGSIPETDIVPLLRSVDLFVLPSCVDRNGDTEGSATAAFEAMACGAIALVSEVGGNVGSIRNGEVAFYFKPANATDLAERIVSVLALPPSQIELLKSKARPFIDDHYSWDSSIAKYLGEIKKIPSLADEIR